MCNPDESSAFGPPGNKPIFSPAPSQSRRRRLWELPQHCHCPVIGVCLPFQPLRKLLSKALGQRGLEDDYGFHTCAVGLCGTRNRLSEALQRELEQRHALAIQRFKIVKTSDALTQLWLEALRSPHVAGPFWAGLTHPACDAALLERMCQDIHMLQHQAGASARVDQARLAAMLDENRILTAELGRVQERTTRLLAERDADIRRLDASLMQMRTDHVGKDTLIDNLRTELVAVQQAIPDLHSRKRLKEHIAQLEERIRQLEHQLQSVHQLHATERSMPRPPIPVNEDTQAEPVAQVCGQQLQAKRILCVGGREGSVTTYRQMIERIGGQFMHHDGGRENNLKQLDASLAAADLVICQTGCISHNAYWRVKDFCKRTGKRCMYLENPSVAGLSKGLEHITGMPES